MKFMSKLFFCSLMLLPFMVHSEVHIQVNQQQYRYAEPVRLAQVLAPLTATDWYWPATGVYDLNAAEVEQQRNHILQLLDQLVLELAPQDDQAMSLRALRQQIESWQLARRITIDVHYDRARLDPKFNPMFTDGEYLLSLKGRPDMVYVSGQVMTPGAYEFQPVSAPFHYVEGISTRDDAETDFVFVIEPSGAVSQVGIAYWNRQWTPVMPGSQIIVPISSSLFSPSTASLNRQIAELAVHRVLP